MLREHLIILVTGLLVDLPGKHSIATKTRVDGYDGCDGYDRLVDMIDMIDG